MNGKQTAGVRQCPPTTLLARPIEDIRIVLQFDLVAIRFSGIGGAMNDEPIEDFRAMILAIERAIPSIIIQRAVPGKIKIAIEKYDLKKMSYVLGDPSPLDIEVEGLSYIVQIEYFWLRRRSNNYPNLMHAVTEVIDEFSGRIISDLAKIEEKKQRADAMNCAAADLGEIRTAKERKAARDQIGLERAASSLRDFLDSVSLSIPAMVSADSSKPGILYTQLADEDRQKLPRFWHGFRVCPKRTPQPRPTCTIISWSSRRATPA
jgi:hypothetical protein